MKALKCDRCGKFYIQDHEPVLFDGVEIDKVSITRGTLHPEYTNHYDVCPSCAKSFVLWFKEVESDIAKEAMTENELHSVVE